MRSPSSSSAARHAFLVPWLSNLSFWVSRDRISMAQGDSGAVAGGVTGAGGPALHCTSAPQVYSHLSSPALGNDCPAWSDYQGSGTGCHFFFFLPYVNSQLLSPGTILPLLLAIRQEGLEAKWSREAGDKLSLPVCSDGRTGEKSRSKVQRHSNFPGFLALACS